MARRHFSGTILLALALLLACLPASADERLKGIACRSVHLGYPAPEGTAFLNEVRVDHSAPGTYFMVCGWRRGYFGMQELGNGKKLLLFSVWDSGQNDPKAVAQEKRVQLLHQDPRVRIGRFGGEGTGGQAFYDYDWKVGQSYRFLVRARRSGDRTEYAGFFYHPEEKGWKHLVTFSTITPPELLRGYYSFVEDFKRDRRSTERVRQAHFGAGWVETADGKWTPLTRARFTGDSNPVTNIDAGMDGGWFFLATGGTTRNQGAKLRETMSLPEKPARAPVGLPMLPPRSPAP